MSVDPIVNARKASIEHYNETVLRMRDLDQKLERQQEIRQASQQLEQERIARARRLGLDKGQNIDVSV